MDLDLDRMLDSTRRGQWSVDELDWEAPLQGAEGLSVRQRREAGLQLVFTAGLERQAARVFGLCAQYAADPRARDIYRLFSADELRHAEAELRLARRYGVSWRDLPLATRWAFGVLAANFDQPDRGVHELSSATILLFELALDTLLVPILDEVADPVQRAVFQRINQDEARHLAMDYWLLDRKGAALAAAAAGRDAKTEAAARGWARRAFDQYRLVRTMIAFIAAFGAMAVATPGVRVHFADGRLIARYLERVRRVPRKAPHAMAVPTYRMGLRGQQRLLRLLNLVTNGSVARAAGRPA